MPDAIHIPRVNATDDPGEVGVVDFVMLCVKLRDTEAALQQIRLLVGPAGVPTPLNRAIADIRAPHVAGTVA